MNKGRLFVLGEDEWLDNELHEFNADVIAWIPSTELRKKVMNLIPYDLTRRNV